MQLDELADEQGLAREHKRKLFKKYMSVLAHKSDVTVVGDQTISPTQIVLSSENREPADKSLAFTTTPALAAMFEAWWANFNERDGDSGQLGVKLRSLFKGATVRVLSRPYVSTDGTLSLSPPTTPSVGYAWLSTPAIKLLFEEKDILLLERHCHLSLRAMNFAEVVLQAWDTANADADLAVRLRRSLTKTVKTVMQTQTLSLCALLQARRDHVLAHARGLSIDHIQKLRHAPLLSAAKLFPAELLRTINDANVQTLQTRALLRLSKPDDRSGGGRGRGRDNKQGQRQNNRYNNYTHGGRRDDNNTSTWHDYRTNCSSPVSVRKEEGGVRSRTL